MSTNYENFIDKSKRVETEIIGRLILDLKFFPIVSAIVTKNNFSVYPDIFEILKDCYENEKNIATEFHVKNINISNFIKDVSFRRPEAIANDLKEISNSISLYKVLNKAIKNIPFSDVEVYASDIQKEIINEIHEIEYAKSDAISVVKEWKDTRESYKKKFQNGVGLIGLSTGYPKLDEAIDGLRDGHIWILGGYTNAGKSTSALNIVSNLIKENKRVVFYSLEMSANDIISKLLGIMLKVHGGSLLKGKEHQDLEDSLLKIIDSNLSIHTDKFELQDIIFSMTKEKLSGADLFVVDFVQNVTLKGSKGEYETTTTTAIDFQRTARKLCTPTILLSQISNDGAKNQIDGVMYFKGSGALGAVADLAIEVKVAEEKNEEFYAKMKNGDDVYITWTIKKNRHGATGSIDMSFNGRTGFIKEGSPLEHF